MNALKPVMRAIVQNEYYVYKTPPLIEILSCSSYSSSRFVNITRIDTASSHVQIISRLDTDPSHVNLISRSNYINLSNCGGGSDFVHFPQICTFP